MSSKDSVKKIDTWQDEHSKEWHQHYDKVHHWLRKKYGRSYKCENPTCLGTSTRFQWARLKDVEYDFKRENFIMLCVQCHSKYDFTEQKREKMRLLNLGRKKLPEQIEQMSEAQNSRREKARQQAYDEGFLAGAANGYKKGYSEALKKL